jgi:hypothetical protein
MSGRDANRIGERACYETKLDDALRFAGERSRTV